MKRIILAVLVAALTIPAAASARTSVSGGLKQTIAQSFAESNQLDVSRHQIASCLDVYTDGSDAYVTPNILHHESLFRVGGLCESQGLQDWQPVHGLLRHESSSGGYWRALLTFDQIELSQLRHLGIRLAVFENLSNTKPPNYPFVP
jgi:hypothetical protein